MFNTTYTQYMAHSPKKIITVTKSSSMGCTVNLAEKAINYVKDKGSKINIPFARSIVSIAVSCNLRAEG